MLHGRYRTLVPSASIVATALLVIGSIAGCGDSSSSAGAQKASQTDLESAKNSLASPTKVRGKTLPADTNLSARERRALAKEGQLPK
jgi:hypothetical protein